MGLTSINTKAPWVSALSFPFRVNCLHLCVGFLHRQSVLVFLYASHRVLKRTQRTSNHTFQQRHSLLTATHVASLLCTMALWILVSGESLTDHTDVALPSLCIWACQVTNNTLDVFLFTVLTNYMKVSIPLAKPAPLLNFQFPYSLSIIRQL